LSREITEAEVAASQAIDRLDRLEGGSDNLKEDAQQGGIPDPDGKQGSSISMAVMDQWLNQIEGDPASLLRNQFQLEEQLELQRNGRQLMETRPW
jgi:Ca-activated chloride channel family protein